MRLKQRPGPLPSRRAFAARVARWTLAALALVLVALVLGMAGYSWSEGLGWLDALHAAALILTGMGPAFTVHTTAGKVFESVYALFSGLVFIGVAAIMLTPVAHRILHRFHLDLEDVGKGERERGS
jgi:hypothetical protein